jgi:hypothetical protein
VPVVVGLMAWGMQLLYHIRDWLIALPLAGTAVAILLATLLGYAISAVMERLRLGPREQGMGGLDPLTPHGVEGDKSLAYFLATAAGTVGVR